MTGHISCFVKFPSIHSAIADVFVCLLGLDLRVGLDGNVFVGLKRVDLVLWELGTRLLCQTRIENMLGVADKRT